jgi:membrane associated rhomboid family serine protease
MGIHDRDYYREDSGGFSLGKWSATNWLVLATCAVFVLQMLTQDFTNGRRHESPIEKFGVYSTERILQGEAWRLLTCVFLHADLWHLAFNMLVLWWAGSRIEELYGRTEFTCFYLFSGAFANLIRFALEAANVLPPSLALGASGAVMAVLVLYAFHDPYHKVSLFFVVTVPLWFCVVLYIAFDLLGALGMGRDGIGHVAHLGGALFGFLYWRTSFRFHRLVPALPSGAKRAKVPALRVVHPDDDVDGAPEPPSYDTPVPDGADEEPFETKVDRVLAKVGKTGQESLTPEEREILFRASEVYKKRRR